MLNPFMPHIAGVALGFLKRVPREAWYILLALAGCWLLWNKAYESGYNASDSEWQEAARIAAERAREADSAAIESVIETREELERENEEARAAAERSDDPLRSLFDSLR